MTSAEYAAKKLEIYNQQIAICREYGLTGLLQYTEKRWHDTMPPQAKPPQMTAPERSGTTGYNQTLTPRRKCGIIKAIKRHLRRKIKMEVSKMDKVKIWSVCVNHVTWDRPQTLYFNNKEAATECYNNFEYADKPQYIGAYNPQKVAAMIDTNPANVPQEVVLLYYRSYAEYIDENRK